MHDNPYIEVLQLFNFSDNQKKMIMLNYSAPGHTITARVMAKEMGYSGFQAANLHYGTLAKKIADFFDVEINTGDDYLCILVEFIASEHECHWKLKNELIEAIEIHEWGNKNCQVILPEETTSIVEGAVKSITVNAYERNPAARKACIDHYGYSCLICETNLESIYGPAANSLIHVHHIKPIADINKEYEVDPIKDLVPLCPNCHAVIHRSSPPYSIDEMKKMIYN